MNEIFLQKLNNLVPYPDTSNHLITPKLKVKFLKKRLCDLTDIRDKYASVITFKLSNGLEYIIPDERFPHDARLLFDEMEKITKFLKEYKDIICELNTQ